MSKLSSPTKLVTKVKVITGLLSFFIITTITLGLIMNKKSEKDSFTISIAGKNSMLCQKITKDIFYIKAKDSIDFVDLQRSIKEFNFNLKTLKYGNDKLEIPATNNNFIKKKLEDISTIWQPFPIIVEALKNNIKIVKKDKETYMQKLNTLLNLSNEIVLKMVSYDLPKNYIDLSGRQRMLSQRMALYLDRYLKTNNQNDFAQFKNSQKLYDLTLKNFLSSNLVKRKKDLYNSVKKNQKYWLKYKKFINIMLDRESEINAYIDYIKNNNIELLDNINEVVRLYTKNSEKNISSLKYFQYGAMIIALLIILYSFLLTKDLETHIDQFVQKVKKLSSANLENSEEMHIDFTCEDELKEASTHINAFAKKVNDAMKESKYAIKQTKYAVNKLETISNEIDNIIENSKIDTTYKSNLNKKLNNTEDIAIQSSENLLSVSSLLKQLQDNLNDISTTYLNNMKK